MIVSPLVLYLVWAALAGLVVGSYLNVLAHRLPAGRSTVRPRSSCPFCGGIIPARDNIPLLSFVLLGGRCRRCGAPISWRYPALEALTAVLFVGSVLAFGLTPRTAVAMLFCALMLALAAIDAEHYLLPDRLTLPGILAGLATQPLVPSVSLLEAVVGTVLGAGLLILLMNYWYWLRGEEGMGMGDVNMAALIGAFLGWKGLLVALVTASLSGAATGIVLMAAARLGLRSRLPFGTFLALGSLVALFAGDTLVDAYARLL